MKDQQSIISLFVAYATIRCSNRRTGPDMATVFHIWLYGRFIEIQSTSGERNFIERMKVPIFLEAVLAIEIM